MVLSGPEASDSDGPPDPKRAKTVRFESATQDEEIAEENGTELYLTSGNGKVFRTTYSLFVSFTFAHQLILLSHLTTTLYLSLSHTYLWTLL